MRCFSCINFRSKDVNEKHKKIHQIPVLSKLVMKQLLKMRRRFSCINFRSKDVKNCDDDDDDDMVDNEVADSTNTGKMFISQRSSVAHSLTFHELAIATENFKDDNLIGEGGFSSVYKGRLESGKKQHDGEKDPLSSSLPSLDKHSRRFSLAEIRLATHDFDEALVIGKGGFGKVYKGKIDYVDGTIIHVAIKRANLDSIQGANEFWAEIEMLSKFRHSHIVSLLGYCEKEMILVYEYMPNGSLEDYLHKRRANSTSLTWLQRLNICIGAARGLDYLHTGTGVQCRVLHHDIKSANILLDDNLTAKISDFGVSRIGPKCDQSGSSIELYTDQIRGTFGYVDAEYFSTHRLTRKTDVYAFGVVLLEVLCGRPALDFTLDKQQHSLAVWAKHCIKKGRMGRIIDPCLRGKVPYNCLKEFGQIAYECILTRSKDRPTMTKVVARLEFVLTWTLQSAQRASNRNHIGRSRFIDKAWSMCLTKGAILMRHDNGKTYCQGGGSWLSWKNNRKGMMMMEKHAAKVVEVGCHSGGVATGSRLVVPRWPHGQAMISLLKVFKFSELQRATNNYKQDRILGEGAFGKVYKGWLDTGDGLAVAIKKYSPDSDQGFNEWQKKVTLLGKFSHLNVIKLFGYCWEKKNFDLVYEYMQKGSLDMHLFTEPLPWDTRIKIAMGVAQGLAFLHSTDNNIICRDVRCSNILLDENYNAKLSDFGLARLGPVNGESHVSTAVVGTYGYAAPAYLSFSYVFVLARGIGQVIDLLLVLMTFCVICTYIFSGCLA